MNLEEAQWYAKRIGQERKAEAEAIKREAKRTR